MKNIAAWILLAAGCSFAPCATAEDTYRLRFRMEQSGGSQDPEASSRTLVLHLQNKTRGVIDDTRRIPYVTNPKGDAKELHTVAIGNLIECRADGEEAGVRLDCNLESSYAASDQPAAAPQSGFPPVIRSRRVKTNALAPIGQDIRIARFSDASRGHSLDIFVLAERFSGPVDPGK